MDLTIVLIFIILTALTGLLIVSFLRRKPNQPSDDAASDYAEGLNHLLQGNREQALQKLKEAAKKNSTNVDVYLKIGDILRDLGQVEKAINVHKYLTVRSGLSAKQKRDILRSLARDYQAATSFDKALGVLDGVLEWDKTAVWAREMKLKIYEDKEQWDKAYQVGKEFSRNSNNALTSRLALYKVQEGLQLLDADNAADAQSRFQEAIKIDPVSPPAYICLADSYVKQDRSDDALKTLRQFVERVPSQSYLALGRIKELLYEGGVYGEIENLYRDIIEKQPDNLMVHLALVENYEKKGELQKAIATCLTVLEKEPANKVARNYLVRLYHKSGDNEKAVSQALSLVDESLQTKQTFCCKLCNHESEEPFWRCPECLDWETFIKS